MKTSKLINDSLNKINGCSFLKSAFKELELYPCLSCYCKVVDMIQSDSSISKQEAVILIDAVAIACGKNVLIPTRTMYELNEIIKFNILNTN